MKMEKEVSYKDDGRKIIFYTFANKAEDSALNKEGNNLNKKDDI